MNTIFRSDTFSASSVSETQHFIAVSHSLLLELVICHSNLLPVVELARYEVNLTGHLQFSLNLPCRLVVMEETLSQPC